MSDVRLEAYSARDRDGLASLVADVLGEFGDATDPLLDADLEAPEQRYRSIWVLKAAGSVVGSVAITPPRDGVATVKRTYLRPALRGRGWGHRLLEAALDSARQERCHTVLLDTTDQQHAARHLYESAGFLLVAEVAGARHYAKAL